MEKGSKWGIEWTRETDPLSGVEVTRLSHYKGHCHHLYFTNPGWYQGGKKVLMGGDRENCTNLFGVDLENGEITQLTGHDSREGTDFDHACVNQVTNEVSYWYGRKLWALNLETLETRPLYTIPEKQNIGMVNATADGKYVIFCMSEDLSDRIPNIDMMHGYVGFRETWELRPFCQIVRVPADGSGKADVIHSGKVWMGHLNTSSAHPTHLTFCHEGPWELVDHRIWAMDTDSGKVWPLRERRGEGERIGHEYWYADGERVGYHGFYQGKNFLGSVKFDGSGIVEGEFPQHTTHVHSNDQLLAVGDGAVGGSIQLWRWNGKGYDPPRILCEHRCSMHIQVNHVHPRLSPDGSYVLFTSDKTGYGSPYTAFLPKDVSSLPFAGEDGSIRTVKTK
ncbi:MAG: oligogalacturonate lyase family protein [Treponema sp.]|jgi:oligogalacturonide lyase|nr:oligogalacturonate lyase family protein [Treponema sp.]